MKIPVLSWMFRQNKVIPIAGHKEDPALLDKAMEQIHQDLQDGWAVCIFPEGDITRDGALLPFRSGIERIVARDAVPVIPMALSGLWGSFFSRQGGSPMTRPFRRVWSKVWVTVGKPIPPEALTASHAQDAVAELHARRDAA